MYDEVSDFLQSGVSWDASDDYSVWLGIVGFDSVGDFARIKLFEEIDVIDFSCQSYRGAFTGKDAAHALGLVGIEVLSVDL